MFERLKTYLAKGTTFYGLEVFQSGGATQYHITEIARRKGELHIVRSNTFGNMEAMAKELKPQLPLYLVYNTASVITKTIEKSSALKQRALVENLFPGLNFEDFLYQIAPVRNCLLVSICKKKELEDLMETLKSNKIQLVGASLGPGPLHSIIDFLQEASITTNSETIALEDANNNSITIARQEKPQLTTYDLNGLAVDHTDVLGFGGVVDFLSDSNGVDSNFGNTVEGFRNNFTTNRTFTLLLRSFIVILLGILLVNFLVFNRYFEGVGRLRTNLALDSENKKNLTLIRNRVNEKEKKVDALISRSNSRSTYYLDRLAATVPQSILLSEIQYQPLARPVQDNKPIELERNTILVLGSSKNSADFSDWINRMEAIDWVETVETKDYDYSNNNSSEFKLQLYLAVPQK